MNKLLLTLTATAGLATSFISAAQPTCQDDPRLYTIKTVMADLAAGKAIEPLKMTPGTYLALTDKTRAALGDNINVLNNNCVPVQVLNGEPVMKLQQPYETLNTELQHAAIRRDKQQFFTILRLYRAEPKASSSIISLISPLDWPASAVAWAREQGVLSVSPQHYDSSSGDKVRISAKCHTLTAYNTHIELFALLGGVVGDNNTLLSHTNEDHGTTIVLADTNGGYLHTGSVTSVQPETERECGAINYASVTSALGAIQMAHVENGETGFGRTRAKEMKAWLDNTYPTKAPAQKAN